MVNQPHSTSDSEGVRIFWPAHIDNDETGPTVTALIEQLSKIAAFRPDLVLADWEASDEGFLIDLFCPHQRTAEHDMIEVAS
jgi:hypothetical protein